MREISGDYAQAFLRAAWESAPDGAQTFKQYLLAVLGSRIKDTANGRQITGTSAAGQSVSFYIPPALSPTDIITPVTLAKLANQALKLYDRAEASGVTDESAILGMLLDYFEPITEATSDFTHLRFPPTRRATTW